MVKVSLSVCFNCSFGGIRFGTPNDPCSPGPAHDLPCFGGRRHNEDGCDEDGCADAHSGHTLGIEPSSALRLC